MALSSRNFLPRSLFGRALTILLVPIVVLQLVVGLVFFQRHYLRVTEQMTRNVAYELAYAVEEIDAASDPVAAAGRISELARPLELWLRLEPGTKVAPGVTRDFFDFTGAKVAVQGFGNVGGIASELLAEQGAVIVGVTDWKGGVYNAKGLDTKALAAHVAQHKTVAGFAGGDTLKSDELFGLDVDILIPAALENQITAANAGTIKAKLVVEGANGPTTPDAHKALHQRGVFIVPDILANAGGVTTSYFEWVQDRHGYFWSEKEVNERLEAKMMEAFGAVLQTAQRYTVDMRTAAYIVAINRVATVTKMRGMYA